MNWLVNDYTSAVRAFRCDTINTGNATYRGKWVYDGDEIDAGDMFGATFPNNTHPTRWLNGANAGGNNITGSGTIRATGQYFYAGRKVAHVAVWTRALTTDEIADIYTAAQVDG